MSARTLSLAIETSNPSAGGGRAGVALGWTGADGSIELLGVEPLRQENRHADDLMGAISRVCARAGVHPPQLGRIAVSIGPGGYTALRIATATAAVLGEACGVRVVAVPTPAVAGESLGEHQMPALICLASKRETTHATRVDGAGSKPIGVIRADALDTLDVRTLVCDGFAHASFRERAGELGIESVDLILSPEACLRASAQITPIEPTQLRPVYAREPDAETQWRERTR